MRFKDEEGQAMVLMAISLSIFLFLAVGIAVDGSHIYLQHQMAQTAADAAAQAGMLSIFDGTNTSGAAPFTATQGTSFPCTTTTSTPCAYANKNGFSSNSGDTVNVSFPADTAAPGVSFSSDPVHLIQVTVQRPVGTIFMRVLGASATTVGASAMAAIVNVVAPVPILVTHPTLANSLSLSGTPVIQICGGPSRSIQVNSNSATAVSMGGNSSIDLSHAGPPDPGNCTTGTGSDFGNWGGPSSSPSGISYGTTGHYVDPSSPIQDPLASVTPPAAPVNSGSMGTHSPLGNGISGCPSSPRKGCELYSPGLYTGGIDGKISTPVFKPGIYYIQSNQGMLCNALCDMYMATGFTDTGAGTTGTGWTGNILVYNTGSLANPTATGPISLGANGSISLVGSPPGSSYKGILFFQDRNAAAQSHSLGGGGNLSLQGTIYLTNPLATMTTNPAHYQSLSLKGGSGNSTLIQGEIIVGTLSLGGNGSITMNLNSTATLTIREVALVN